MPSLKGVKGGSMWVIGFPERSSPKRIVISTTALYVPPGSSGGGDGGGGEGGGGEGGGGEGAGKAIDVTLTLETAKTVQTGRGQNGERVARSAALMLSRVAFAASAALRLCIMALAVPSLSNK